MPNRLVRDGILTSFQVNSLSQSAELFYRRLMSVVDDYGRIEAYPEILLAKCYPLKFGVVTIVDIETWLSECCVLPSRDGGLRSDDGTPLSLVSQYTVNGKKLLQINNFGQRTRSLKYPGPELADGLTRVNDGGLRSDDGEALSHAGLARATNTNTYTPTDTNPTAENGNGAKRQISGFDAKSLADKLWHIHPSPAMFGSVEQSLAKEIREQAPGMPPEQFAGRITASLESWAAYWLSEKRHATGLAKWITDGDYTRKPPTKKQAALDPSPHETPEQMRTREAKSAEVDEVARATRLAEKRARKEGSAT